MAGREAAAPRGPCGPWLCLLVALALDVLRGQREGKGEARGGWAQAKAGREGCPGVGKLRVPELNPS